MNKSYSMSRLFVQHHAPLCARFIITEVTLMYNSIMHWFPMNRQVPFLCSFVVTLGTFESLSLMLIFHVDFQVFWSCTYVVTFVAFGKCMKSINVIFQTIGGICHKITRFAGKLCFSMNVSHMAFQSHLTVFRLTNSTGMLFSMHSCKMSFNSEFVNIAIFTTLTFYQNTALCFMLGFLVSSQIKFCQILIVTHIANISYTKVIGIYMSFHSPRQICDHNAFLLWMNH